jgi:hypothetical protein
LFHSYDGDVLNTSLGTLGLKVVVNLAAAEDDSSDLVVGNWAKSNVIDNLSEPQSLAELLNVGARTSQLQKFFRRHNDSGLAEWSPHLGTKEVEVVGGSRRVDDSHIDTLLDISDSSLRSWSI